MMRTTHTLRTLLAAFAMSAVLSGCAATSGHETPGQYLDDSAITVKVKAALFDDQSLKSMQISVETFKNVVQLSGFVDSEKTKARATEVVRHVEGVQSLKNDLNIR